MSVTPEPKLYRDPLGVVVEFRCDCGKVHKVRMAYSTIDAVAKSRRVFALPRNPLKETP